MTDERQSDGRDGRDGTDGSDGAEKRKRSGDQARSRPDGGSGVVSLRGSVADRRVDLLHLLCRLLTGRFVVKA